jgi:hypothetical protein
MCRCLPLRDHGGNLVAVIFDYYYEVTSTNSKQGKEIRKYLTDQEME